MFIYRSKRAFLNDRFKHPQYEQLGAVVRQRLKNCTAPRSTDRKRDRRCLQYLIVYKLSVLSTQDN